MQLKDGSAEHLTLGVCCGKYCLEVLLLNLLKTFDVVSRLQMKQTFSFRTNDFFLMFFLITHILGIQFGNKFLSWRSCNLHNLI